jgi:soluble lytic murein transglycosylase
MQSPAPFAETRNYVQRVMENLQVYRVRFNVTTPAISYLNLLQRVEETSPTPITSDTASGLP